MSFTPEVVSPEYSVIESRDCYAHVKGLKYPADAAKIKRLTLVEKQVWYASQDPQELITIDANTKKAEAQAQYVESDFSRRSEFSRFWFWHYIVPLKLKRCAFWFKFW